MFQALFYGVRVFNSDITVSATVPLAQAIHESKNWTSDLYTRANNMFGMKMPKSRKTKATGSTNGYAAFSTPLDSIRDYFDFLRFFGLTTDAKLIAFVKKEYAEDPNYFKAIQRTVASVSGDLVSPVSLGLGVAGGLGLTAAGFALLVSKR